MATFTQKHYEKLAAFYRYELEVSTALQTEAEGSEQYLAHSIRVNTIKGLIRLHSNTLQKDNPKFNPVRFFKACGLDEVQNAFR